MRREQSVLLLYYVIQFNRFPCSNVYLSITDSWLETESRERLIVKSLSLLKTPSFDSFRTTESEGSPEYVSLKLIEIFVIGLF